LGGRALHARLVITAQANEILKQAAITENIGLESVLISLIVLAGGFLLAIRWLVKTSKPKPEPDFPSPFADEELLEIYQYLSISDLMACASVSRQWHRVSKDEKLWYAFCQRDFPPTIITGTTTIPTTTTTITATAATATTATAAAATTSTTTSSGLRQQDRPVWLPNWQDYYVYQFKYMTSFNIGGVIKIYWKMMRKHGHQWTMCFLALLPILLGLLTIVFVHYAASSTPTNTLRRSATISTTTTMMQSGQTGGRTEEEAETAVESLDKLTQLPKEIQKPEDERQHWELPQCSGETCVWLILIAIAVTILVYVVIPVVSFVLSWIEPVFLYVGLQLFGGYDEHTWKYLEEHKSTTVLLGATLLSALLFSTVLLLAGWRIARFGVLNYKSRREKFIARLKLNWNEFKQSKSMRRRLRALQERLRRARDGMGPGPGPGLGAAPAPALV
jgi:hypothetical protein